MNALRAFLRWWGRELAAALPLGLRAAFAPPRATLVARPIGGGLSLALRSGATTTPFGALDALDGRQARRLARAARAGRLAVALGAPAEATVTRRVTLPAAAEADLDAVLGFELDRISPFGPGEAFFGGRVAARRDDLGRIDVDVTVTPRAPLDAAVAALTAAGLPPDRVEPVDAGGAPIGPALGAPGFAPGRRAPPGARLAGLGLATLAALLAAWAAVDLWTLSREAADLEAEVAGLRDRAVAAADRRRETESADAARFAAALRAERPRAVAVLAALSETLPDDAWLISVRVDPDAATITGFARNAAALVPLLDADPAFAAPRFLSPVTRDGDAGRERFSLSLTLARTAP